MTDVRKLTEELLTATGDVARAKATIDALRAAMVREAHHRLDIDGMAPSWRDPGDLGSIRWDAGKWQATVTDMAAFTSWLAQRSPDDVVATITVPAQVLEKVLDAITESGITATATVEPRPATTTAILDRVGCVGYSDNGNPTESSLAHLDGEIVPGAVWRQSPSHLVVALNPLRKKAVEADARREVAERYAPAEVTE